jgi:hypothetical protein
MPDLMTILVNISSQIAPIIMMLQGITMVVGLWFVGAALLELWGVSNDNALKYLPGANRFSVSSSLIQLALGGIFSALGTLQLVGVMSRTVTGEKVMPRFISYAPADGSIDEQRLAAIAALLGIMQVIGFVAMFKSLLLVNDRANQQSGSSYGTAIAFFVGGVVAWNFKWFVDVLNCSLGFNVISIFGAPFGATACS